MCANLGCGTGLASLAAAKLGAKQVLATDGNDEVVELAKINIERNQLSSMVQSTKLQWGILDASDYINFADVIIGSDLTYNSGSWRVLAETLSSILKPGGLFVYLSLGHSGFNVSGEIDGFLSVTQNLGLVECQNSSLDRLGTLLQKSLTEDEKMIIEGTGGYRLLLIQKT